MQSSAVGGDEVSPLEFETPGREQRECLGRRLHRFWFLWFLGCTEHTKKTIIKRIECHSSTRHGKENERKKRNVIKADILVNMKYLFGNPHHRWKRITKPYRPTLCQVHFRCVLNRRATSSKQRRAFQGYRFITQAHKASLGQIGCWEAAGEWMYGSRAVRRAKKQQRR